MMTYEQWIEKYKPVKNHLDSYASFDRHMFETYGAEYRFVCEQDIHNVWTVISGEKSEFLTPGRRWVNRVGYFISEIPWKESDEWFEIDLYE